MLFFFISLSMLLALLLRCFFTGADFSIGRLRSGSVRCAAAHRSMYFLGANAKYAPFKRSL